MSASTTKVVASSQKRPLEDPSSPSAPTDQPDAKRPALEKSASAEDIKAVAAADDTTDVPAGESAPEASNGDEPATDPIVSSDEPVENGTKDDQGDISIPDAPNTLQTVSDTPGNNDAIANTIMKLETHPIQSTVGSHDHGSRTSSHPPHQDETGWVHIRAVISSAEAATVIGKGGENVTQIRRLSGAKCTVSDYSRGAVERILTVSGLVDANAKVRGVEDS